MQSLTKKWGGEVKVFLTIILACVGAACYLSICHNTIKRFSGKDTTIKLFLVFYSILFMRFYLGVIPRIVGFNKLLY